MLYNNELVGYEILDFKNRKIGDVISLVWTARTPYIDGFVILKNKFFQSRYYLPYSSVECIDDNKLLLIKNYKTFNKSLEQKVLYANFNSSKNIVSRFTFDENTGCVKSVEVAKNIFEDLKKGRKLYNDFCVKNSEIVILSLN